MTMIQRGALQWPGTSSFPVHMPVGSLPCAVSELNDQQKQTQVRLISLIDRSGYDMVQMNGQRKTGPPRDWVGPPPGPGCEVFIGKIPRDLYEDELFPLLAQRGRLYELRLMMDFSGTNRGFGFAQFATPEDARRVVEALDGYPIRPGKYLGVMKSLDNRRLFVGGLPKDKMKDEIRHELSKLVNGIVDVILYSSVVDKTKNRGFAFVEFESHRVAAIARRKMIPGGVVLWDHDLAVDWAEPEPEVPESIMAKVKVLYMRNLMLSTTESAIRAVIEQVADIPKTAIEKVKKLKDFAFLHFSDRHFAERALPRLDNLTIDNSVVTVVWAKPPRDRVEMKSGRHSESHGDGIDCPATCGMRSSHNTHSSNLRAVMGPTQALDCYTVSTACPPPTVTLTPYSNCSYWETLVSLTQGSPEPVVEIQRIANPGKINGSLYIARVTLQNLPPVPQNSWMGMCCDTAQDARESAAECALNQLFGPPAGVVPLPSPAMGVFFPPLCRV